MASLIDVFRTLFPDAPNLRSPFDRTPLLPADVFAFSAHVLERSGAYHHVAPTVPGLSEHGFRQILVEGGLRDRAILVGKDWLTVKPSDGRRLPDPPPSVQTLWSSLKPYQDEIVFSPLEDKDPAPVWWLIALELMMIADEASRDIGFEGKNPFSAVASGGYVSQDIVSGEVFRRIQRGPFSISSAADDIVCVQPKSRTPTVGCTLRSLSHHLALLPPRGQVRVRWVEPITTSDTPRTNDGLSLLLVPFPFPFPFRIADDVFRSVGEHAEGGWGWFDAHQSWLPRNEDKKKRAAFVTFVKDLVMEGRRRGERIDGVVFPELALNYAQFKEIAGALANDTDIDFLIAGVSDDGNGRQGNFVATAPFFLLGSEREDEISGWEGIILIREKHHRWKLEAGQIKAYDLKALDAKKSWWENIGILSRSLDMLVYRGNTTLTTLICEDLARVDPCQAVIRAVGPNLLIALLMDGPQLGFRWPGRYATVLADDPGTSVLSFTSLGLIERQNQLGRFDLASSVALWKDDANELKKLELPRDADAIVLKLNSTIKTETSLDGRSDGKSSYRWTFNSSYGVSSTAKPDWVKTGQARS